MTEILNNTFLLLAQWDNGLWHIIFLSLRVSLSALAVALLIGLPLAALLTVQDFRGKQGVRIIVDTMMALPPVVVGLMVYLLLSRTGPLGVWGLLYTPTAMIIAQALLITPIVIALATTIFEQYWKPLNEQLRALGIPLQKQYHLLITEARLGIVTVGLAAFGRAIAEIGAVMVVGGNIEGETRVMTTAIAMETQQGNLYIALALGIVLITVALVINGLAHLCKRHI